MYPGRNLRRVSVGEIVEAENTLGTMDFLIVRK